MANEAFLDKRLDGVEVGVGDVLGGREGAAACKDAQAREELPLGLGEKLVRPLDRCAQRLLAWIRIAAAPKSLFR